MSRQPSRRLTTKPKSISERLGAIKCGKIKCGKGTKTIADAIASVEI
jgi:hypothetical protein